MAKIIIAGSRTIKKYDIEHAVWCSGFEVTTLLNGKCPTGIDKLAADWAKSKGISIEYFPADWKKYGKSAGPRRNRQMANADVLGLILIWNGKSSGSRSMKEEGEKAGLFIYEIIVEDNYGARSSNNSRKGKEKALQKG